jgi:hypothetical protein
MRTTVTAMTSLTLAANTSLGLASSTRKPAATAATHAVRGTVRSISTFFIVAITGSGKRPSETTFMLTPETEREGNLSIGAIVSIRYRMTAGHVLVATAVSAEPNRSGVISGSLHR